MTKSYLVNQRRQKKYSELWEDNILARKFTINNISKQLKYNLGIYTQNNESLIHKIIFLFLSMIQLFFYTLGAFLILLDNREMPSLQR